MTKPALTPKQELELVDEYLGVDDWTIKELTIIFKVSERTVYRVLAKHNAKRNKFDRSVVRSGRDARGRFTRKPKSRAKGVEQKERPPLKPCGTDAAYRRHKRRGEYPDTACLEAHALDVKQRKKNNGD